MTDLPWKPQKESFNEALKYLKGRKEGIISSLKTPWPKVNNATLNGFEWHSTNVVGGRPGTGKTVVKDQLIREAFRLNPTANMRVLDFSLEMLGKVSAIRGMSSYIEKSYKYLCSAEEEGKKVITDEDLKNCLAYAQEMVKYNIDVIEDAPTVKGFEAHIVTYMKHYSTVETLRNSKTGKDEVKRKYQNTVITLDHSILLECEKHQTRNDMLYELGATLTRLKRKYPIIFIILSQLNRSVDHPERNEDGKYGNYILDSDIFGADALLQHADTVIGLNLPGRQKIRFYGPERYIIPDDKLLVMHFLKSRNGENGLTFFNAAFNKMRIDEVPTPARGETRARNM